MGKSFIPVIPTVFRVCTLLDQIWDVSTEMSLWQAMPKLGFFRIEQQSFLLQCQVLFHCLLHSFCKLISIENFQMLVDQANLLCQAMDSLAMQRLGSKVLASCQLLQIFAKIPAMHSLAIQGGGILWLMYIFEGQLGESLLPRCALSLVQALDMFPHTGYPGPLVSTRVVRQQLKKDLTCY